MKQYRINQSLWDVIEKAVRNKHNVGEEFILTAVDFGTPYIETINRCAYRIASKNKHYQGVIDFEYYLNQEPIIVNNEKINQMIAEYVMNWELLEIGYYDTSSETKRQKELESWMNKNNINNVGKYYIHEKSNLWIKVDKFSPTSNIDDAWLILSSYSNFEIKKENNMFTIKLYEKYHKDKTKELYKEYTIESENLMIGICLAALKSKNICVKLTDNDEQ